MMSGTADMVFVLLLVSLFSAPGKSQSQGDLELEKVLSDLENLPEDATPEQFQRSAAIQELVISHRKALPLLKKVLEGNSSSKTRLAAAYALKEIGYPSSLRSVVDDGDARVRNYARAVLVTKPRARGSLTAPQVYVLDEQWAPWASTLAESEVLLSLSQQKERLKHLFPDLVAPVDMQLDVGTEAANHKYAALAIARKDPVASMHHLVENYSELPDRQPHVLDAMRQVAANQPPVFRAQVYEIAQPVINASLNHSEAAVRRTGTFVGLEIAPLEITVDILKATLKDTDQWVRYMAFKRALDCISELESAGRPVAADELLQSLDKFVATHSGSPAAAQWKDKVNQTRKELEKERKLIDSGDILAGGENEKFLRVGAEILRVTEDEYSRAIKTYGKPYLTREQFDALRKDALKAITEEQEAYRLSASRVTRNAAPEGPPATSAPKGVANEGRPKSPSSADLAPESHNSPRVLLTIIFCAALGSLLAWAFFRRRRSTAG